MFTSYLSTKTKDTELLQAKLRDLYQLFLYDTIFNSPQRLTFVAKGLPAAKLAYGKGPGGEKVDLLTLENIKQSDLEKIIKKYMNKFQDVELVKKVIHRYSNQFILKVKEDALEFNIVLEVSKLKSDWKRGKYYEVGVMKSKDWAYRTLAQVALLSQIEKDNPEVKQDE